MSLFYLNMDTHQFKFTGMVDPSNHETQPISVTFVDRDQTTKLSVVGTSELFKVLSLMNSHTRKVVPVMVELWGSAQP